MDMDILTVWIIRKQFLIRKNPELVTLKYIMKDPKPDDKLYLMDLKSQPF